MKRELLDPGFMYTLGFLLVVLSLVCVERFI